MIYYAFPTIIVRNFDFRLTYWHLKRTKNFLKVKIWINHILRNFRQLVKNFATRGNQFTNNRSRNVLVALSAQNTTSKMSETVLRLGAPGVRHGAPAWGTMSQVYVSVKMARKFLLTANS